MQGVQIGTSLHFKPSEVISNLHYRREDITTFIREENLDADVVKHMYTTDDIYKKLNRSLSTGQLNKFQKRYTMLLGDAIYNIIEKLPKKVYRGLNLQEEELKDYKRAEGKVIYWYGFTSTSQEKSVAQRWGTQGSGTQVLIEIELEKGNRDHVANMTDVSEYPKEKEVLVAANAGYLVERVDVANKYMQLVLVDNDYCPMWERD